MKRRPKPKSNARRVAGGIAYMMVLALALGAGTVAGWAGKNGGIIPKMLFAKPVEDTFHTDTLTVMILGCDQDIDEHTKKPIRKQARSDMMLIVKLDFKNKMITGVSIPRDTESRMEGHRDLMESYLRKYKVWKINSYHAIALKGHENELTQYAVEDLLPGVKIDRIVTLDFDAFQEVVNMVGGVRVYVDKDYDYDDNAGNLHIHLKKGWQVLNGYDAMCFVRARHSDTDLMRQARQKQFLAAFKEQALKQKADIPAIANEGVKVLGDGLNFDEIGSLVKFIQSVPQKNIDWGQVPIIDQGGAKNLLIDKKNLQATLERYKLVPPTHSSEAGSAGDGR